MDSQNLDVIQDVIDEAVRKKQLAGVNCLIFKDDKEIAYFESGFSDIASKKKFSRNTICRLYSMSKPVTAVAAMILLEKGKIELCDEVSSFLPEFKNLTVCKDGSVQKCFRPLLVQDLLNMTSGYTYGGSSNEGEMLTSQLIDDLNKSAASDNSISTRDFARRISQIPLSFEPGTDYQYGLSADILGALIQEVSGMRFSDFLKKNIFEPLSMDDTDFYVPFDKYERLSSVYDYQDGTPSLFENCNLGIQADMKKRPAFESGGAGLCSCIDDYMNFVRMLTNKGVFQGKRILKERTVDFLSSARLRANIQQFFDWKMEYHSGYSYCNLVRVCIEPEKARALTEKGEFGWDGWLGPYMSVDTKNQLGFVLLMQRTGAGTTSTTRKIKNILYSSL